MESLPSAARPVKAGRPVHPVRCAWRWLRVPVLPLGIGRLLITAETRRGPVSRQYDVGAHLDPRTGRVLGWRLVRADDEGYDVVLGPGGCSCTCGDFV